MVSHIQAPWQEVLAQGKQAFDSGDSAAGKDLFSRALSLAAEESAAEADIGDVFYKFGCCLLACGERAEGRQRLNQALRTFERSLGPDSTEVLKVKNELASLIAADEIAAAQEKPVSTQEKPSGTQEKPSGASPPPAPGGLNRFIKTTPKGNDPTYDQIMAGRAPKTVGPIFIEEFIHPREKIYGFCTAAVGIWLYCILTICLVGLAIAPLVILAGYISAGIHLGHLRSRGIKVSTRQFPEIYDLVDQYSTALNMQPPEVYVVQEHGLLNAFANRLHRKDMIVIYSDVVELAYEMGEKEMAFVVCHELAHIKRGHVKWAWVRMPGDLVPFLGSAYSRACEYTCDRVAAEIVPDGALFGLVCLAAGTKLYRRVNLKALYEQAEEEWGFWTWFTEIQSTHPNLNNRIRSIGLRDQALKVR